MADIFLRSTDGNDGNAGTAKEAPKDTLVSALTAAGAGGRVFMSSLHAETQASSMTLASPGTAASPVQILCVADWGADTGSTPPTVLATTGTVTTTGVTNISLTGYAHSYGVSYIVGFRFQHLGGDQSWIIEDGTITCSHASATFDLGADANELTSWLKLVNTNLVFSGTGAQMSCQGLWDWFGGTLSGTIPTTLISIAGGGKCRFRGVDLSAAGSGKTLFGVSLNRVGEALLQNCKLGSSVTITSGTVASPGAPRVTLINCDSADTNYRFYKQFYEGEITQETTIVRTGGASDGTTPISRKMVSNANSKIYSPLMLDGIAIWNESVGGALTATIEVVTDNVTLTDKEAWLEVEYLGTSGFPMSLFANDRASHNNAHLGSGANQTSSSEIWTTTGLGTPIKQALSVAFTPQEKGPVRFRVMLAKPSTTMYVCPKVGVA